MLNKNAAKRAVALLLTAIVLLMVVLPEAAQAANKCYLPTKVTVYQKNKSGWKKLHTDTYKYDKEGNIIKSNGSIKTIKYTYKDGVLSKAVLKGKGETINVSFNKKGYISKAKHYTKGLDEPDTKTYTTNSKGLITQDKEYGKYTHRYSLKGKTLKKVVERYKHSTKERTVTKFKKGLPVKRYQYDSQKKKLVNGVRKIKYSHKKGLVKKIDIQMKVTGKVNAGKTTKVVFSYDKKNSAIVSKADYLMAIPAYAAEQYTYMENVATFNYNTRNVLIGLSSRGMWY